MNATQKLSPVMRQYHTFKSQHKDSILLFRMGDFYEVFYEDAELCSRVLGITLTSRSKGENPIPMAGVPYHSVEGYLKKLVQAGYHVAMCEQVQDAREAKGIVDRDVTRIVTPGTLTEDTFLEGKTSNYLAAIALKNDQAGLAWVELSTGQFQVEEIPVSYLMDELSRIAPAECLVRETALDQDTSYEAKLKSQISAPLTRRPDYVFDKATAKRALLEHFGLRSLDGLGCESFTLGVCAAGALIDYLQETQKTSLEHINRLQPYLASRHVLLDHSTQRSLELVENLRDGGRRGTLFSVLDRTRTSMGGRLLKEWMTSPLRDVEAIEERLAAVHELVDGSFLRKDIQALLQEVYDMERISAKIACRRANGRDLVSLKNSTTVLPKLKTLLDSCVTRVLGGFSEQFDTLQDLHELITKAIVEEPPSTIHEGSLIARGYHSELDELLSISKDGQSWLSQYQAKEIQKTGIPSLKVGFNQVFGYYIEITHLHSAKAPPNYHRKQTLKNAERYITPELKEFESKVLSADEKARELEYQIFVEVRDRIAEHIPRIQKVAEELAMMDVFCSLAEVAVRNHFCRPDVTDGLTLHILDGRHPVLDVSLVGEKFVPNDVFLDGEKDQIAIITGPNMAGKSTYIRQVALITLMAQMGSYVPARNAEIGVTDRIFTRVGAADDLSRGQSTFMVEMNEMANILNNATERSLLILDEVGRGTSTFDGVSIAWAVCEYLSDQLRARTLFATHYHELTALASIYSNVKNFNIAVREWEEEIIFLRKIIQGGTDKSYGIYVARLAGIPAEVIERAKEILINLESHSIDPTGKPKFAPKRVKAKKAQDMQLLLFSSPYEDIVQALRDLDTDSLAPFDALLKIKELQKEILQIDGA